jgi:hypothetical protein
MMISFRQIVCFGAITLVAAKDVYEISVYGTDEAPIPFESFPLPENITLHHRQPMIKKTDVYGDNWCGAVQQNLPSGTFNSVVGTWTVPNVSIPADGTSLDAPYSAAQWVGIDGFYWNSTCDALIQAGTALAVGSNNITSTSFEREKRRTSQLIIPNAVSLCSIMTTNL